MNYPNGPYHQGQPPQQPGYPQIPGPFPPGGPPPQWGYPQPPGYPYPPVRPAGPSGTTATTAAALAGLGALGMLGLGLMLLLALSSPDSDSDFGATPSSSSDAGTALFVVAAMAVLIAAILLAVGAVTLMQRKMIGRWLVVGGCAITILVCLLIVGGLAALLGDAAGYGVAVGYSGPAVTGLIFPILTLVLALLPSTAAWIRAKPQMVAPPYPPPYRG